MRFLLLFATPLILLTSCSDRIYFPDRVTAPMLKDAGEVRLNTAARIQTSEDGNNAPLGFSVDIAAAPLKHLGLFAGFRNTNKFTSDDFFGSSDSLLYKGSRFEFGAGYIDKMGSKSFVGIYFVGGFGDISRKDLNINATDFSSNYYRLSLQPEIGFNQKDIVVISFGSRFTYQRYNNFRSSDPVLRSSFTTGYANIDDVGLYFMEPYINFNVGYKYISFNMQPGWSFNLSSPSLSSYNPFYLSMGLNFQFAPRMLNAK